uniref:Uncharacterized mitochondrial protein AtMg00810-like n=1 Tax=Tanacetum cinerariifolium TaxID=118510 RepID=A0A6L2M966_TANCI|nr:uncharacterized mitochondrial protein AtMg00810-like [Tanacetum cinerariifolium]
MKVKESLKVIFDETPPPPNTSPLKDDDLVEGAIEGSGIETIVYADSDHARDYVDRKSTSGIYTFMRCCLTSLFSKKQTALAISTTEDEYDNKVPIILGRPMLATAHASIHVTEEIKESEGLKEFLMNDDMNGDLEDFLEENDLLPKIKCDTFGSNSRIGLQNGDWTRRLRRRDRKFLGCSGSCDSKEKDSSSKPL